MGKAKLGAAQKVAIGHEVDLVGWPEVLAHARGPLALLFGRQGNRSGDRQAGARGGEIFFQAAALVRRHGLQLALELIEEEAGGRARVGLAQQRGGKIDGQRSRLLANIHQGPGARVGKFPLPLLDQFGGLRLRRRQHLAPLGFQRLVRALEHVLVVSGQRGPAVLEALPCGLRLLLLRRGIGERLSGKLLALFDHFPDRTVKEPPEQPYQNEEVDRLQRKRPPIDLHR